MIERTFSADAPHTLVIYATADGTRYLRQERAVNRFAGSIPEVTAAIEADPDELAPVEDGADRERYATEAERIRARNAPSAPV